MKPLINEDLDFHLEEGPSQSKQGISARQVNNEDLLKFNISPLDA